MPNADVVILGEKTEGQIKIALLGGGNWIPHAGRKRIVFLRREGEVNIESLDIAGGELAIGFRPGSRKGSWTLFIGISSLENQVRSEWRFVPLGGEFTKIFGQMRISAMSISRFARWRSRGSLDADQSFRLKPITAFGRSRSRRPCLRGGASQDG